MGKAKKRNFHICVKNSGTMDVLPVGISRVDAIKLILNNIKSNNIDEKTEEYIGLFGITPEELAEAGASYESLVALKSLFI